MANRLSIWNWLRPLLCVLFLAGGLHVFAQQEDSLRVRRDSVPVSEESHIQFSPDSFSSVNAELPVVRHIPLHTSYFRSASSQGPVVPYYTNHPSPMFRGDYATSGVLGRVGGGYVVGAGSQTSVPGVGRFNAALVGWQKQLSDRLQLQLMADALKMNTARFTGQSFGLSGQMVYQVQDRLYFRAFGGVGFGDFRNRPAYGAGGAIGVEFTERFGVEFGAQSYYNSLTGRWEVLPVVAPYYKFDKFKLQLDLGPILFDIIRGAIQKHRGGSRGEGPTIMPDVPGFSH